MPYASLFTNSSTDALLMSTRTDSAALLVSAPLNAGVRTLPRPRRQCEPERLRIGGDIVTNVVVRSSEPETRPLDAHIQRRATVAPAQQGLTPPGGSNGEVMVEHIKALAAILGGDSSAACVVDDVVLDEAIVAAMDRDTPLGCTLDGIPDERELVAVDRCCRRPEIVMKVDGVTAKLIRPDSQRPATRIEPRVVDSAVLGSAKFPERGVSQIHIGTRDEHGMTARAIGIL